MVHIPYRIAAVHSSGEELSAAQQQYRRGERRSVVFRDLVLSSVRKLPEIDRTVLDIGCGHGFDGDMQLQRSIAAEATRLIGVEPDADIVPSSCFSEVHRTLFESAPLEPESVHVAYAAFVLEHIQTPKDFLKRLHECLAPGGVFWGFTVDSRHPFVFASTLMEKLRLKGLYLNWRRGSRGKDRYENYPTFYRINSPRNVIRHSSLFSRADALSLLRPGQMSYYVPRGLQGLAYVAERFGMALDLPGSLLVVRLEK